MPEDTRRLRDMRRAGAVEAPSGGVGWVGLSVISRKVANTRSRVALSADLRKIHLSVNQAAVAQAGEAREWGRRRIRANKEGPKVETLRPGELKPAGVIPAEPLK